MKRRPLTAFLAGRICEAFMTGQGFAELDERFKLAAGTAEGVHRRWNWRMLTKRKRRRGKKRGRR